MEDILPPFTLQIITQDQESYYELSSSELHDPKPLTDLMKQLVDLQVNMAHQPVSPCRLSTSSISSDVAG